MAKLVSCGTPRGHGWNQHHSSNQSQSYDNTRSFTCWAIRELLWGGGALILSTKINFRRTKVSNVKKEDIKRRSGWTVNMQIISKLGRTLSFHVGHNLRIKQQSGKTFATQIQRVTSLILKVLIWTKNKQANRVMGNAYRKFTGREIQISKTT